MYQKMLGEAGTCQRRQQAASPSSHLSKGAPTMPKHLQQTGAEKDRAKLPPQNKRGDFNSLSRVTLKGSLFSLQNKGRPFPVSVLCSSRDALASSL